VSLIADLGIGANFFKITNITIDADNEELDVDFELYTELAFKVGGGLLINDKYCLAMHYWGLGEHNVKSEMHGFGQTEEIDDSKMKVSLLTLTFGIKF
jgi:hypothetical protein